MISEFSRPSDKDLNRLASLLGDRITKDEPIGPYTTYRVGGSASLFMRAMSVDDLHAASRALAKVKIPVLMLGRGSNMLISNSGFRGLAIALGPFAEQINLPSSDQDPIVVVGRRCAQRVCHGAGISPVCVVGVLEDIAEDVVEAEAVGQLLPNRLGARPRVAEVPRDGVELRRGRRERVGGVEGGPRRAGPRRILPLRLGGEPVARTGNPREEGRGGAVEQAATPARGSGGEGA